MRNMGKRAEIITVKIPASRIRNIILLSKVLIIAVLMFLVFNFYFAFFGNVLLDLGYFFGALIFLLIDSFLIRKLNKLLYRKVGKRGKLKK